MFLLRGVVIATGVFGMVYVVLSAVVVALGRWAWFLRAIRRAGGGRLLFAVRTLPLWSAVAFVAGLTVPAYLYLEPRAREEAIGALALSAAALAAAVLISGAYRVNAALLQALCFRREYARRSRPHTTVSGHQVYEFRDAQPAVLVIGILRPMVLVSSGAMAMLDADELDAAVRHELSHVAHGDNLKKLLLAFCGFPLLRPLEGEWQGQVEMEADATAALDQARALDLASALVKMARVPATGPAPRLSLALVSGPDNARAIQKRVARLVDYSGIRPKPHRAMYWLVLVAGIALAIDYASLLAHAHELSELFIR